MERVTFRGRVRRWDESKPAGLAVVDIPAELVPTLGGRRQYRVEGSLNGAAFTGSTMLVAGGRFAVGVSKASLSAGQADSGDDVELTIGAVARTCSTRVTPAHPRTGGRHGAVEPR